MVVLRDDGGSRILNDRQKRGRSKFQPEEQGPKLQSLKQRETQRASFFREYYIQISCQVRFGARCPGVASTTLVYHLDIVFSRGN